MLAAVIIVQNLLTLSGFGCIIFLKRIVHRLVQIRNRNKMGRNVMKSKLFKRITAAALALLMVCASVPSGSDFSQFFTGSEIVASAETLSGECGANATWELSDTDDDGTPDKLTISGTGNMAEFSFDNHYDSNSDSYSYYSTAPWGGSVLNVNRIKKERLNA